MERDKVAYQDLIGKNDDCFNGMKAISTERSRDSGFMMNEMDMAV